MGSTPGNASELGVGSFGASLSEAVAATRAAVDTYLEAVAEGTSPRGAKALADIDQFLAVLSHLSQD